MKKSSKGFLISAILFVVTIIFSIGAAKCDVAEVGINSVKVGYSSMNDAFYNFIGGAEGFHKSFYSISEALGYLSFLFIAGFALLGAYQLYKRKSIKKVNPSIIVMGVMFVFVLVLYVAFDKLGLNLRPLIMPGEASLEPSFPSSHAMLACVIHGAGILEIDEVMFPCIGRTILKIVMAAMMLVIVFCRLFSGAHWLSDIIAGVLISGVVVSLFYAIKTLIREKRKKKSEPA